VGQGLQERPGPVIGGGDATLSGDADLAAVASALADGGRAKMVLALCDGRALPASVLAGEAGVAPSTATFHLQRLLEAGMVTVERSGRHRYYRLAGPEVAAAVEGLARLAPAQPVRSLRQGTRAQLLRSARTCYDHVAGRLGVALMGALIRDGHLTGGDGRHHPERAVEDRLSAPGRDVEYALTPSGRAFLDELGVRLPARRRAVRYCVDWSEQAHHLSGGAGRGLLDRFLELGWIRRGEGRVILVTPTGAEGLRQAFGISM
jgi:DNA-binding transcriptional ArsR family regulator